MRIGVKLEDVIFSDETAVLIRECERKKKGIEASRGSIQ